MSASLLFCAYLAIHCILLVMSFRIPDASRRIWLVRALLIGVIYDNSMLALGPLLIDQAWYLPANYPRFVMHVLFLPFLVLFAWSAMQAAGVRLANSRMGYAMCWGWVVVAIAWGLWHEVLGLELIPREFYGHQRLVSASGLPPVATIATNILILPMAAAVWRRSGWPWFFLGAIFIFLVNGATGAKPFGFMVGNGAEVVFIASLLATERFLARGAKV